MSRGPEIMADAAYAVFNKPAKRFTGNFLIDDSFLAGEGVTDFEQYRVNPSAAGARFLHAGRTAAPPGVVIAGKRDIRGFRNPAVSG